MEKGIKNIIFDLGGVIVNLDRQRCVDSFKALGANDVSDYVDEYRQEDMFHELEIGAISADEFYEQLRKKTQCEATNKQIQDAWNAMLKEIPVHRLDKLLQLRDNYMTYLLSNTNEIHWKYCYDVLFNYHGFGADNYFEQIFLSFEMHLIKPSETIFTEVLDNAGIKAEETLFVDDSDINCAAARKLGIKTHHVKAGEDWTLIIQ
jgi:FMN phosphatase YigB (HAD superfamily)